MRAPRWARRLLRWLALPEERDAIVGDLEEAHRERLERYGRRGAAMRTTMDALEMGFALLKERARPWITGEGTDAQLRRKGAMIGTPDSWKRDMGHATRGLMRAPGFTVVTVATLALALGSNAAIFSVVDAVLLRALPFEEPEELVTIGATSPGSDLPDEFGVSDEMYVEYRENADLIESMGAYGTVQSTARADDRVERLFMARTTPSVFSTLGVSPILGRLPTDDDPEEIAVISHWLWATWFAEDPAVVGRAFEMAGATREVIGVMPPEFRFPDERVALWVNWVIDPTQLTAGGFGMSVVARLAPDVQPAGVVAQLTPLALRMPEKYGGPPQYERIMERHRPIVRSLEEELVGEFSGPLWVLLGTVGIVLLIACANIANLFIARTEGRRQDLAVRHALGAGRAGLVRAQMAEAFILAGLGAAGGVLVAWAGVPLLVRAAPESIPRLATARLDGVTLLFTAGAAVVAALLFGLMPALRFSEPGAVSGTRSQGGTSVFSGRARDALVVVQTASALVLLVASGLLLQSFRTLTHVDPGFDTEDIFTFQIAPTGEDLNDGPSYAQFHNDFMDRIRALPGVQSVGLVQELPLDEGAGSTFFSTESSQIEEGEEPLLRMTFAGGDYFETMGIEIVAGRRFDASDEATGVATAIVSEATAEQLWPGQDPIGQRLRPAGAAELGFWWEVVGVAENVFLGDFRQEEPDPLVYFPMVGPVPQLYAVGSPAYVVKSPRAAELAPEIRELIREVEPNSPMYRIFTMEGLAARSMAQLSFTMLTLIVAATLALVLGAIGLYGVLSYVVSQRTREIGVRMALGARAKQVRRMVVMQGGRVALVGLAIGLVVAAFVTRVLDSLVFGVGVIDAPTFVAMAGLMLAVALLASWLPARRASSVDPMTSLRME